MSTRIAAGPEVAEHGIAVEGLTKRYGGKNALDGIDLTVRQGEFFCVLGPSGCGKSTLVRLLAGLEAPDAGRIQLAGRTVADAGRLVPPEERGVAMVFQSYALWPHMSVLQNVAFVVEAGGAGREAARDRAEAALEAVALTPYAERRPAALSGGQQQRVALARCLASGARTLLMDEPLANLDPHLREAMEGELSRLHRASGATTVYITHDQREAMALADRIAVMNEGRVLQVADPVTLYRRPVSETVARFVGRGAVVDGIVVGGGSETARVRLGPGEATLDCLPGTPRGAVRVLLRPTNLSLEDGADYEGTVRRATWRGGMFELDVAVDGLGVVPVHAPRHQGEGTGVRFSIQGGWVLPG